MEGTGIRWRRLSVLEAGLVGLERRWTLWGAAALVAIVLLILAAVYVRPATHATYDGVYYTGMAREPFANDNPNAYRVLTPLVAYVIGLRGERIQILNVAVAWLLLLLVYYHYRRTAHGPLLSLGAATILGFSMPTLFTVFFAGYTDSTTYLFVFLMLVCRWKPAVYWVLFLLALLNRESVVFLLPFFLLLPNVGGERKPARLVWTAVGAVLSLAIYLAARYLIGRYVGPKHSFDFYFGPLRQDPFYWLRQTAAAYSAGFFATFKLFWALPVAAVWLALRRRHWLGVLLVVLPVVCALGQSVIAVDTSRVLALGFPSLLVSLEIIRREYGEKPIEPLLAGLIVANLFVPQLYVSSNRIWTMRSSLQAVIDRLLLVAE